MEKRSSYAILSGKMLIYIKISSQEGCFAKEAKENEAKKLAKMFQDNFTKKYPNMPKNIAEAGPKAD